MGLLGRGGPATRRARSLKSGVLSLPDTHAHADPHPALWWWLLWSSPPPSRRAACARPERGEHAHAAVGDDAPRHRARRIAHARSTRKDGNDRPRAKGVGVPLASRRGCSRGVSTKKRADLGSSCHVGHGNATFVVDTTQLSKVPKITCDVSDRKPAPTCQEKIFLGIFFC